MTLLVRYFFILDLLLFNGCYFLTINYLHNVWWVDGDSFPFLFIMSNGYLILAFFLSQQYLITEKKHILPLIYEIMLYIVIVLMMLISTWIICQKPNIVFGHLYIIFLVFFVLDIVFKKIIINYFRNYQLDISGIKHSFIIGNDTISDYLKQELVSNPWLGYHIIGSEKSIDETKYDSLENKLVEEQISVLFINSGTTILNEKSIQFFKKLHEKYMIDVKLISEQFSNKLKRSSYELFGHIPVVNMFSYELDNVFNRSLKRLFDVVFSLSVIILIFSWLFPLIILLIWLTSKGPAFYIHRRIGLRGASFRCLKFRTMYANYTDNPFTQTVKNDKRITPLGSILRKYNLDELPQFINVLVGDISVVGPRPMVIEHMKEYEKDIEVIYSRHWIKPGITGLAQVTGYRGEIDSAEKMKGRIRQDRFYLNNWTFFLDIKIIWWTIRNMFYGDSNAI